MISNNLRVSTAAVLCFLLVRSLLLTIIGLLRIRHFKKFIERVGFICLSRIVRSGIAVLMLVLLKSCHGFLRCLVVVLRLILIVGWLVLRILLRIVGMRVRVLFYLPSLLSLMVKARVPWLVWMVLDGRRFLL